MIYALFWDISQSVVVTDRLSRNEGKDYQNTLRDIKKKNAISAETKRRPSDKTKFISF
jgi:hypothetical protein